MEYSEYIFHDIKARTAIFNVGRKEAHAILTYRHPDGVDTETNIKSLSYSISNLEIELGMRPVFKRYLLSDATNQIRHLPEKDDCARSVIQQPPLDGTKAAVLVIFEQQPAIEHLGNGIWSDTRGKIWMGDNDVVPASDSYNMTVGYFDELRHTLTTAGGSLKDHCIRTWLYVRDIDNNYAGVVRGRNDVFAKNGLTPSTHFIASTGIAGQSADPKRLVAFNAFADVSLHPSQIRHLYGKTHLNPTYEYGVAFERGTAVDYADRRHVYISGTASINNKGEIVAPGDIVAQTTRMLENIGVLLAEASCGWPDVAHLIVYLRDLADYHIVSEIMSSRFPDLPTVIVLAPVCRPGWLIEAECMAIRPI